jgi:hypothetical protein
VIEGYVARRDRLIAAMRAEVCVLRNRARFVSLVNDGKLVLGGRGRDRQACLSLGTICHIITLQNGTF